MTYVSCLLTKDEATLNTTKASTAGLVERFSVAASCVVTQPVVDLFDFPFC